jgi:hypothetical protein
MFLVMIGPLTHIGAAGVAKSAPWLSVCKARATGSRPRRDQADTRLFRSA